MNSKFLILSLVIPLVLCASENSDESTKVFVRGSVHNPEVLHIAKAENIWEAMVESGGATRLWNHIVIIVREKSDLLQISYKYDFRVIEEEKIESKMKEVLLEPGDVIYFSEYID